MIPTSAMLRGLFITLEGPDGAGKTTQATLLARSLQERGIPVIATREPGGTRIGERIRAILHDLGLAEMLSPTEVLLFAASRAQHVGERIQPALDSGHTVVCDRYAESTLAYQGYGRGVDLDTLQRITQFATNGLRPDLVVLLDLGAEQAMERRRREEQAGGIQRNRLDRLDASFYDRVRKGYLAMASQDPDRWLVLDATRSIAMLHQAICERVEKLLAERDTLVTSSSS